MNEITIREDVVKGFCFYLQKKLEGSVKEKKIKFSHYRQLQSEIGDLSVGGVINYKERDEIWARLKTMFCEVFRQMGLQHNNLA
jgi:hypothetical protein